MRPHSWQKLGLLYALPPGGLHPKLRSHTANPLPIHLEGDLYRVYFSARDDRNRSSVGAVDIDLVRRAVVREHAVPFFEHGPPGSYFADGVSIGDVYQTAGARYMLFMGWHTPAGGHWRGEIGRLRLHPDLSLSLADGTPLLGRDQTDPVSLSYPCVLPEGQGFRMWYGSTTTWDAGNGEMLHVFHHAFSEDGHHWRRHGLALPPVLGRAQAFSRPIVVPEAPHGHGMWFSCRGGDGGTYRIGHAHSADGIHFTLRLEEAGIDVSADGWDARMICYPYVFDHRGARYMLYNGNGHGKSGFGLAVLR